VLLTASRCKVFSTFPGSSGTDGDDEALRDDG